MFEIHLLINLFMSLIELKNIHQSIKNIIKKTGVNLK